MGLAVLVFLSLVGCSLLPGGKAPDQRAVARGAVLSTAEAVSVVDQACAALGRARHDVDLLKACEKHYAPARAALIATSSAVDLWDRVETQRSVKCAIATALGEVEQLGPEFEKRGAKLPAIVDDARQLLATLGGCSDV